MDMKAYANYLSKLKIQRDSVFTSISSIDKEVALRLIRQFAKMHLKYWCMFDENGKERNISGDEYPKTIQQQISECCVFILLVSKHSIASDEVRDEIKQFLGDGDPKKKKDRILIPVFLDKLTPKDIPADLVKLTGITSKVIFRQINAETPEETLRAYAEEICEQYVATTMYSVDRKFQQEQDACKFSDLMMLCARNKCGVQTVSEDIKGSNEISAEKLQEMHILSNEVTEYDCNTYSCMVIASNLLGNAVKKEDGKYYDPQKEGVKYFYYYPESMKNDCRVLEEKIKKFIAKDKESRLEVVSLIRREFTFRNKIHIFFGDMNGKTEDDFKKQYHIEARDDIARLEHLFEQDEAQCYFAYSDKDDIFRVPEEFFAWLRGERESYDYMVGVAYDFIAFIGSLVEVLSCAPNVNPVAFSALNKNYSYLLKLQELENWQMQEKGLRLSAAKSKKLVNYLLDYSAGANMASNAERKFPRLASWMEFETDKDGNYIELDEEVRQKARDNLVFVPVKDSEQLKLCYSFAIFINKSGYSGAWYTTGQQQKLNLVQDIVMTYDIEKDTDLYKKLVDAFAYMISLNESAKTILKEHNSKFLTQIPTEMSK